MGVPTIKQLHMQQKRFDDLRGRNSSMKCMNGRNHRSCIFRAAYGSKFDFLLDCNSRTFERMSRQMLSATMQPSVPAKRLGGYIFFG